MKPWWPSIIIKPKVRLARPRFKSLSRPPDFLLFGILMIVVFFVLGGNIYSLVKTPPAIAGGPDGSPVLIAPGIDYQLGMEGIVASFAMLTGTIGLGIIYYSSKYVFQPTYATRLLILGIIMSGVAFLMIGYFFGIKLRLF